MPKYYRERKRYKKLPFLALGLAILFMAMHDVNSFPVSTFYLLVGVIELIAFCYMVDEGLTYTVKEEVELKEEG